MDLQLSNPIISQSVSARSAAATGTKSQSGKSTAATGTDSQRGKLQDAAVADSASVNFAKYLSQALPTKSGRSMPTAVKVPGSKDPISGNESAPAVDGSKSINTSPSTSSALPVIVSTDEQKTIRPDARSSQDANNPGIDVSGPILANFMPTQPVPDTKTVSDSESLRLPASLVVTSKPASQNVTAPDTAARLSADEAEATPARPASALQTGHNSIIEATALPEKQAIPATDFNAMSTDRIVATLPATPHRSEAVTVQHLEIPVPLGNHDWNNQLGQRVVWMSSQTNQTAEIRINPPELGPIELRLTLDNQQSTQNATLHFASPHAEVRDAIENSMPRLRELMANAGITLGNATVSGESFPRQQMSGQEPSAEKNTAALLSGKSGAIETALPSHSTSRGNALLDTFA